MPPHSNINTLCEEQLPSPLMPRRSHSRKGPWSPLWFPGHTWAPLSPRAVSPSPTLHCQSWLTSKGLLLHPRSHCRAPSPSYANCYSSMGFPAFHLPPLVPHQYKLYTSIHTQYTLWKPRVPWLLYYASNPIKYYNFYHNFINFTCHWKLLYKSKSQNLFHYLLSMEVILSLQLYSCSKYRECSFHPLPTCLKGPRGGVFHGFVCVGAFSS